MTLRVKSDCMREFIDDTAQSESIIANRQISISDVVCRIIKRRMLELNWECE